MTAAAGEILPGSAFFSPERYLTPAEQMQLSKIRFAARRSDWLLGRWTVKHLLTKVTGRPLAQLEIRQEEEGAPYVWLDNHRLDGSISISHRDGSAFCAYCPSAAGAVGADLEKVEPRSAGFERDYFTPAELAWLAGLPGADQTAGVALIWSLKEAALKALKKGLRLDTRVIEVQPGAAARLKSAGWHTAEITSPVAAGPWRAAWKIAGEWVWTLAGLGGVGEFEEVI